MERQAHARLLSLRDHGLEKVPDVRPHLVERVCSLVGQRWEIFHAFVIESGPSCTRPPGLLEIALHGAVCVPVVFDDRQSHFAGRANRLNHFLDVRILVRTVVDGVGEARDHQVCQREAVALQAVHHPSQAALFPRNPPAAGNHVLDAELPDPSRRGCRFSIRPARRRSRLEADLRRVGALEARSSARNCGGSRNRRSGRRRDAESSEACSLQQCSSRRFAGHGQSSFADLRQDAIAGRPTLLLDTRSRLRAHGSRLR